MTFSQCNRSIIIVSIQFVKLFLYYDIKQSLTFLDMIINSLNVVRLLLASISSIHLTETPVTEAEIELKETYKNC